MKRNLKFIWGSSQVIRGRWFFGLVGLYERHGCARDGMAISVRGLLRWVMAATGPAYLATATALFWVWHYNPYSALTYCDALCYPARRAEIVEKQGEALIAQGTDLFRAGKYHEGARLLRLGLARHPQGFRGRLLLAQYHLSTNQRSVALRVMSEGLTGHFPGRWYLEWLFDLSEQAEDYDRIAQISARYLSPSTRPQDLRACRWLIERRFNALSAAGRWHDALASVEREPPGNEANERRVLALLALREPAEALAFLQAWRETANADLSVVTRLQIRALRESGQFEAMGRAMAELRERSRAEPAPAVFGVVQQAMAGRDVEATEALEDYFFRFGGTPENLLLVAEPLAEIGNLPLLQRSVSAAAERGYPTYRFQILLVESLVEQGEWELAARALAAIPSAPGRDADRQLLECDWMQRVITAAQLPTKRAQHALLEFLRGRPWQLRVFRTSIDAMVRAERFETARDALGVGQAAFPASVWLRTKAEELDPRATARVVTVAR